MAKGEINHYLDYVLNNKEENKTEKLINNIELL